LPNRIVAALPGLLLVLIGAAACGDNGEPDGAGDRQGFNDADVQFATDMIPHHAQALEMVNLTMGRKLSPEVRALADDIMAAQGPEVEQMVDMLEEWGQPVPETSLDHSGHGMAETDMPGMASPEEMASLEAAQGEQFEQMFLTMMIEHHRGAIEMAEEELANGQNAEAQLLAESIREAQQQEIDLMTELLES